MLGYEGDEQETLPEGPGRTGAPSSDRPTVADEPREPSEGARDALGAWRSSSKRIAAGPLADLRKDTDRRRIGGYEIVGVLGSGGAGTVYEASDPRHDRLVAIKLFMRQDDHGRARFQREIAAVAKLRHPGIVPLFDSGEDDGCLYMVMERIGGSSLAEIAQRHHDCVDGDPMSIEEAVRSVRDATRAIHYAHTQGILHRDIKPHNLLVDPQGNTHVTDFGLALLTDAELEQITRTGAALGTPAYMPPEQASARRAELDARSDVYSLGATLFHALTGETPFERQDAEGLLFAIFRGEPPPPSEINSSLPPALDAVVLRCLAKEPQDRYPSAEALADDLTRFLDDEPVLALQQKLGPVGRAVAAARRHHVVTGLSVALVLSLVAFAVLLVRYEQLVLQDK